MLYDQQTLSSRLFTSSTGKLTAAKTMLPIFFFSVLGLLYSPLATAFNCSKTLLTAISNGTCRALLFQIYSEQTRSLSLFIIKEKNFEENGLNLNRIYIICIF